ncbi:glycosyltransferase [Candidatus Falkowbacteria bacterium]|nr:glycosyltransferase [Candidatus Falkowbacteria bacterium]
MKIALVHDHLNQLGGAEKVLFALNDIYKEAPVFTLIHDKERSNGIFERLPIQTSFIQKMPFGATHLRWYLSLMPTAFESFDLGGFDVVLSSTSAFSKGVIVGPNTLHICYCHTPTRYLWQDTHEYVRDLKQNFLIKKFLPLLLTRLRQWDFEAGQRPDVMIANSRNVQNRIKKYYQRDSTVIYPPVEIENFGIADDLSDYYLAGGRLVSYKRFDLVVKAFTKTGIKLKIFGTGPEEDKLRKTAGENVEFLGHVSQEKKAELYSKCLAFIHPQEEDFGITPVEAMASGRPVIAYNRGGALETVVEGVSGTFFDEQIWEALADLIIRFDPYIYNPLEIRKRAERFGVERFKQEMQEFVALRWNEFARCEL